MLKAPFSLGHTCDANTNAKARYTCELHQRKKWKKFLFLALRLQFTRVNRGNANANAKNGIKKNPGSIGSMPPRRSEVQERTSGAWVIKRSV